MTTTKSKLSAAVAAKKASFGKAKKAPVAKKETAKAPVAAKTEAPKKPENNIDKTQKFLATCGEKGKHIDVIAAHVDVSTQIMRRLIDQVRARGWYVIRTERCTFTLGAKKEA